MDFKKKARAVFSKEMFAEMGLAVLGGALYAAVPTVANVNGWWGLALGLGSVFGLGFLLESKGMILGGIATATAHLMWTHGSNVSQQWLSRPMWTLQTGTPSTASSSALVTTTGVMNDPGAYVMPSGYMARALPPSDTPRGTVSDDYIMQGQGVLADDNPWDAKRYEQNQTDVLSRGSIFD